MHSLLLLCRYIELLSSYKPKIDWDSHCSEHHFTYKYNNGNNNNNNNNNNFLTRTPGGMRHKVYYPSLKVGQVL